MRMPILRMTDSWLLGAITGLLLVAAACAAMLPSPALAQNPALQNAACMQELECLGDDPTLPGASNCTEQYCFSRTAKACPGNLGVCYTQNAKVDFAVKLGTAPIRNIADYIQTVYDLAIGLAAALAAVMMMIGGFQYLTAGDSGRVSDAKERIQGALVGLVLAMGAYTILNTVNPQLVNLELPLIPIVQRQTFAGCTVIEQCKPCGEEFAIKLKRGADGKSVLPTGCNDVDFAAKGEGDVDCVGKGCNAATTAGRCSGDTSSCQPSDGTKQDACGIQPPQGVTPTFACQSCTSDGQSCEGSGPSDSCCGGFCGDGLCTSGDVGSECNDDSECKAGKCAGSGLIFDGYCTEGTVGSPCEENTDCAAGLVCRDTIWGWDDSDTCSNLMDGEDCVTDRDCGAGYFCKDEECRAGGPGAVCSEDDDCMPGHFCFTQATSGVRELGIPTCSPGTEGTRCDSTDKCQDGLVCSASFFCRAAGAE
jgi:hypothetical protein